MTTAMLTVGFGLLLFTNPGPASDGGDSFPERAVVHGAIRDARTCLVTDDGFVVGTASGVAVLSDSGRLRDLLSTRDGLPGARVDALARSGDGVWVGTEAGLAHLDPRGSTWRVDLAETGVGVSALFIDERGPDPVVWVGTWGEGLVRQGAGRRRAVPFEDGAVAATKRGAAARVTSIERRGETLMVGTAAGLFELDPNVASPSLRDSSLRDGGGLVHGLLETPAGLWIHELNGSYRANASGPALRVGAHDVRDSARVGNAVWLATYDAGLVVANTTSSSPADTGPLLGIDVGRGASSGRACAVGPDALWIKTDGAAPWQRVEPGGLPSGDVAALLETEDGLWAGTFDRGLSVRAHGSSTWRDVSGVDAEVNALAAVPGVPGVFVGTADGLYHVRPGPSGDAHEVQRFDVKSGLPSARVQALQTFDDGSLVVGTSRGIARLRNGRLAPVRGAQAWSVFALATEPDGSLWIGTTKGLVRLDASGHKLYFSMLGSQLPDDWITALAFGPQGSLFVGTYAAGVVRLSPGTSGPHASKGRAWARARSSALGGGRINIAGLTVRGTTLWAATMDTLLSTSLDGPKAGRWTRHAEATLGRDATALVFEEGETAPSYVAGRRGIVEYEKTRRSQEP